MSISRLQNKKVWRAKVITDAAKQSLKEPTIACKIETVMTMIKLKEEAIEEADQQALANGTQRKRVQLPHHIMASVIKIFTEKFDLDIDAINKNKKCSRIQDAKMKTDCKLLEMHVTVPLPYHDADLPVV